MESPPAPLHLADQLTPLLRSLRKRRGLTQAQLGQLLGVSQARVAEIEANPGVVGIASMIRVLSVLGASLQMQVHDSHATVSFKSLQAQGTGTASEAHQVNEPKRGSW